MASRFARAALGASVVLHLACGGADPVERPAPAAADRRPSVAPASATAPAARATARRIVFLGDSLTAGLGLPIGEAYPSLIEARLAGRSDEWTVVNAGVSGDTSAGGLRRLDWSIADGAAVVVVALGGNDGLRGLPVDDLRRNLDRIVERAQAAGARVILAGMEAPPNNGPEYAAAFHRVYPEIAEARGATFLPFLLDGVAGLDAFNQADGIHPNQEGARRVADLVWQALEPIVRELEAQPTR
jgi:acyl-CoA thioesterase-1